jgi:chromosome segregation ATPase
MQEEIRKVLSSLEQVQYHLSLLPELCKELSALGATLPPLLKSQAEELARSQAQIREVRENEVFKATEKLVELEKKIADAQQRHSQLEASEKSMLGRLDAIRERVEKAWEGFKLQPAAEA